LILEQTRTIHLRYMLQYLSLCCNIFIAFNKFRWLFQSCKSGRALRAELWETFWNEFWYKMWS